MGFLWLVHVMDPLASSLKAAKKMLALNSREKNPNDKCWPRVSTSKPQKHGTAAIFCYYSEQGVDARQPPKRPFLSTEI